MITTATVWLRGVAIFAALAALYLLTYTGQTISSDEQKFYDAAHSLVKYGHLELNFTNDLRPYQTLPPGMVNLRVDSEPMQMIVTAPLIWAAAQLPGVGLMQAAWLLNSVVTALTGALLYGYGVQMGYSQRAALLTALAFGVGTSSWVYSQMYFREPLFTLFAVMCALCLERWRLALAARQWRAVAGWGLLVLGTVSGAFLTKEAALLLIPALVVIGLPVTLRQVLDRRVVAGLALLSVVVIGGVLLFARLLPNSRLASVLNDATTLDFAYFWEASAAYLLSPGFSVWTFSPVLLLTPFGAWQMWRSGHARRALVPLVLLLTYVLGYSIGRASFWYGGAGWGARFLVPVIPFLALWLLPIAEGVVARRWRPALLAVAVGLVAQSVMAQVLAVSVPVRAFPNYLYNEGLALNRAVGNELVPWRDGTWNAVYLPHLVNAHQASAPTEIAWMVNGTGGVLVPACILLALAAGGLGWLATQRSRLRWRLLAALIVVSGVVAVAYLSVRLNHRDRRYGGDNASLWAVLAALESGLRPTDAIILGNRSYRPFFMNYYRQRHPIYVLPNAPGEVLELSSPPEVITPFAEERAHPYQQIMLARSAATASRWWLVTEYTPFSAERNRATEHYMARHYFAGSTVINLPDVRLIQYAPISAPPDTIPPWPAERRDDDFGAARLLGYDLPRGTTIHAGEMLPISLLWRHDGWPAGVEPFDYSVNVSLVDSGGVVRAQRAETPQGSFGQMTRWQAGGYYRDNVALSVPPEAPPGEYEVWVLIFDWRDNRKLPVTLGAGATTDSGATADYVMLTKIVIR
jgi:hypothetical protein